MKQRLSMFACRTPQKNSPARHRVVLQAITSNVRFVAGILWDRVLPADRITNYVVVPMPYGDSLS